MDVLRNSHLSVDTVIYLLGDYLTVVGLFS